MARNMAYAVTVANCEEMEGCDKIHYIHFAENGYGVIASKEIKEGDVLVYIECDAILPESNPKFEFLRARCYKETLKGYLIKNMKMRGKYSNGLVMTFEELGIKPVKTGTDLTETLKIRKYEPEDDKSPTDNKLPAWKRFLKDNLMRCAITRPLAIKMFGLAKKSGAFPTYLISKSDEENIMNIKWAFEKYKNEPCYVSTKIEGQSMLLTAERKGRKIIVDVFGRNTRGNTDHFNFCKSVHFEGCMKEWFKEQKDIKSVAVQGEFIADGTSAKSVQKGIYHNGTHFYVYKINVNGKTINLDEMQCFCNRFGFETVPILFVLKNGIGEKFGSIEEMQEFTEHQWFEVGAEKIVSYDDRTDKAKMKGLQLHRNEGIVVCGLNKGDWSYKAKSFEYQLDGLGKIKRF